MRSACGLCATWPRPRNRRSRRRTTRVRALGAAYVGYAADHPQAFALVFDPEYCAPGDPDAEPALTALIA